MKSIFVYNFVDPNLKVETLFKKYGRAENLCVDFETGYMGTSGFFY